MTLYIPIGPPGSGKSTLFRHGPSGRRVCPDEFRLIITDNQADQTENNLVFEICHKITRKRCERGLHTYFDATNLTMEALRPLKEMPGDKIVYIWEPNPYIYSLRNKNREMVVPDVVMGRMLRRHASTWERKERLTEWAKKLFAVHANGNQTEIWPDP
jgi:predicted kinase